VEYCLAQGGLGWVYLAQDTHLDNDEVVLKGVIDQSNAASVRTAVSERRFLTTLHHHNIVRIRDFAIHTDPFTGRQTGYIVMEYLRGPALSELGALPLDAVLGYGQEILAALDYVHGRGLLYTDMKPSNVIRTADRCKLIDIGSVVSAADPGTGFVHTPGFYDDGAGGPTVRSDLYAVGVTLAELFPAAKGIAVGAAVGDVHRFGVEPFRRLVDRATHEDRARRFGSAAEMAVQVAGVLRDVLPDRVRLGRPETSELFTQSADLLDDGLGAVPPLRTWTGPADAERFRPGQPGGPAVAVGLPTPRTAAGDANAVVLDSLGAVEPDELLEKLTKLATSMEVELVRCRALLRLGRLDEAGAAVVRAGADLASESPRRWRIAWHHGLLALARDDPAVAAARFDDVYADLPGECPPRLALAYCAERGGDTDRADDLYRSVWRRDRLQASAAFGLARLRLATGARDAAVAFLDAVPRVSSHYDASRIAAVRILAGRLGTELPQADHLNRAVSRVEALRLDGGDRKGPARQRLLTVIRQGALDRVREHGPVRLARNAVFGSPPSERAIRTGLEASFRSLATQATTASDHGVLIDRANEVRPWSRR
jgi:serine/threonine-protein kinase PknG